MSFGKRLLQTGIVTSATAAIGTAVTDPDTLWYKLQRKPSWQPPKWLFPVAWTALYGSIAASSAKVLQTLDEQEAAAVDAGEKREIAAEKDSYQRALGLNLVLNAGWSALFWQGRNHQVSAVEAAALAVSSVDLARRSAKVSRGAGAALIPYGLWTSFATALTTAIAKRN